MKQFAQNKQKRKGASSCNITEPAPKAALHKHGSFEGCDPLQAVGDEGIKLLRAAPPTHVPDVVLHCSCNPYARVYLQLDRLNATNYFIPTARIVSLMSMASSATIPAGDRWYT
jgi:hypothetical protein